MIRKRELLGIVKRQEQYIQDIIHKLVAIQNFLQLEFKNGENPPELKAVKIPRARRYGE